MFLDKFKEKAGDRFLQRVGEYIEDADQKKLARMWWLFEKSASKPRHKREAERFRRLVEEGHPFGKWLERVGHELSPAARKSLIQNLYGNAWFLNAHKRDKFKENEGFEPPNLIVTDVTARCNLRCEGCWASEYGRESDLELEYIEKMVSEAEDQMGLHFFVFSGGEPTLRKDLFEIYENHPKSQFQVYTNGTLIDDGMAARFAELGNVMPMLSIEGGEALTDGRRGEGIYQKVMEAMDTLRRHGVLFGFSATGTRHNVETIMSEKFIEKMIDKGCLYGWYFQYIPVGREPDMNLMVTARQREMMRQKVYELRNTYPIFLADFWNDGTETKGCMAGGKRYLHVNNDGDIEPCVFCHFAVDNIKDTTITAALRHPFFKAIRDGIPYDGNYLRPCMLIDRPWVFREYMGKYDDVKPTHKGAESLITTLADDMDDKAGEWARIADKAWKNGEAKGLYPYPSEQEGAEPPGGEDKAVRVAAGE